MAKVIALAEMFIFDTMNVLDIVLGVFLLIGFLRGFQKGFIIELSGILALLLGIYAGLSYGYLAEHYIEGWTDWSASTVEILGFFAMFVLVLILVSILAKLLTTIINSIALGLINKIFGAIFGVIKTALFLIILLLLFEYVNTNGRFIAETKLEDSVIVSILRELTATLLPSFQELLEDSELVSLTS
ncbi:CvpA family protein [Psychroflexus tropicus]|uniref:CvpA family protein n=1 Tax=Psychroflexus tropicus TaxID=197345 RepID=UPI0003722038|nr:CvpA family protein [Psychroflexus tropicus]